jgi:hypothetical protein
MTDATTQEPAVETPQLTLQDLALVLTTLQVVTQRGAIQATEMEIVGGLYNRLATFVAASTPTPQTTVETPADTETAPAADTTTNTAEPTQGDTNGTESNN